MASIRRRCFSLLAILTLIQVSLGTSNLAEKVTLDLYYESLCPFSANFISNELPNLFLNGLIDIVDLRLFPWGNARLNSGNFDCQHGPDECLLNTVEACAIDTWPNLNDHFPYISCVETLVYEGNYTKWPICFKEFDLDPNTLTGCYKGAYGKKLELKYANLTAQLNPPHTYVPWVLVAGKPIYLNYPNFMSYICKAYKGPTPSACKKESLASIRRKKTNAHFVSYTEHTAN
ncbi:hypothetical protein BVRB_7g175270 [Beta vulgaris subsp. vulgaris]|nr:hypothetical protein BVRB_7g175270 [Beta vulgaris subsp. vulgaris]